MQTMPHGTGTSSQTAVHDPFAASPAPATTDTDQKGQRRPSRAGWWPLAAGAVAVALGGAVVGSRYVDHKVNSLADRGVRVTMDVFDGYAAAQSGNHEQAIAKLEPLAISSLGDKSMSDETRATIVDTLLASLIKSGASAADHAKVMPELIKTIDDRLPASAARQEQLAWWYLDTGDPALASARFDKAAALYDQRFQRQQSASAQVGMALAVLVDDEAKIDKAVGLLENAATSDPAQTSLAGLSVYLGSVNKDPQLTRLARTYPMFRANAAKAKGEVDKKVAAAAS